MYQSFYFILYGIWLIAGDVDRRDGASNSFTVINHGRLDQMTVLMFLEDVALDACFSYCVAHLRCHTVSYSSAAKLCELNDMEFDEDEAIEQETGWINYGTPSAIDGGFTDWKPFSNCSRPCGGGHVTIYRTCDNPRPQHGGSYCNGEEVKTEQCNTHSCICYGAKDDSYGEVEIFKSGLMKGIRLIHVSGELVCWEERKIDYTSRWGCNPRFSTFVTNEDNKILLPDPSTVRVRSKRFYEYDGKNIDDDELAFDTTSPIRVEKGEKLRIWFGEDLYGLFEHDNSGTHCIDAIVIYEEERESFV